MPVSQSSRWCFTLNNYTDANIEHLRSISTGPNVKYLVFGREVAPTTGTHHLQGFIILSRSRRLQWVRDHVLQAHWENARGTSRQASDYCKKEGDFEECGTFPDTQGQRNDFEAFKLWAIDQPSPPNERAIARAFPALWLRYSSKLRALVGHLRPKPRMELPPGGLFDWQKTVAAELTEPANDRKVVVIVDPEGASGKSFFARWHLSEFENSQMLRVGKRDDLAYAIDPTKSIFFFDIPKGQLQYFNWNIVEQLKDQTVFSTKYEPVVKQLATIPHTVVLTNEYPDESILSADRWCIRNVYEI